MIDVIQNSSDYLVVTAILYYIKRRDINNGK
jgi:hypothetical protein